MSELTEGVNLTNLGGPAVAVGPSSQPVGVTAIGPEVGLVKFAAKRTDRPMVLSGSIYAAGLDQNGTPAGPLVGIAKWGSGNGGQQIAEFDIPMNAQSAPGISQGGGTLISVVGTSLEISARNDSRLLPRAGDQRLGLTDSPAQVTASIGVGNRAGSSRVYRTVWMAFNTAGGLGVGLSATVAVPPFAKAVRIVRFSAANTMAIQTLGFFSFDGPINVAANVEAPDIIIASTVQAVTVQNTGGTAIQSLVAIFEIGI